MKKIAEIITVMSVLALAAACGGGGSSSNPPTPVPPPPAMTDTTAPTVMFDPATGSVLTGQTFAATLTATDDIGVTSGPDVSCSNGGSFANNLFTAPDVTAETTSVCTATAGDAAGNEGSATLTMTVTPPPDTTDPVVMFTPATGSVLSGQTFAATLTATDDVGVTSGPDVSCSNGGSFANNLFTAPDVTTETTSVCTATAGDAAGNEGSATLTMTVTLPASVIISGQLTFDFVPHDTASNGLDYSAITQNPMRGVVVQALDASGTVLDSDISDASGNYALDVSPVIDVRIRARAVLRSTSGATWDVRVTDNTNNNALHVLDGSLADSGTTDSIRNLNAGSGWDGSAYTGERAAGPFAILDPVYDTMQKFAAVDPDIAFPPVEFRWSVDNRAVDGNREDGEITTSSYVPDGGDCGNIYLLGDDDADTDEYDPGVVVREWGHYFEHCLSRSDSPGGPHAPGERLDPRLALAEGWGDAVAAIGTGDPVVRNTFGPGQGGGSVVDVEANTNAPAGWYNARSVSSILYDVYDSTDDGADVLSLGLGPIYRTLVDPGYTGTPVFTTIFTVLDRLKVVAPGNTAAIEALAAGQDINGTGADGAGETNDGGIASALPVYHTAVVDGAAVEVCSVDDAGTVNKLGNRAFVRVSVPTEGTYTIAMSSPRGNPVFAIFRAGTLIATAFGAVNSETWTGVLPAGEYVIEAFDFNNIESLIVEQPADYCYDITAITGTPPPDTTPPVAIFDPATGSVPSGQTFAAILTATDDIGVTSGPTVVCSNGGSFANNLFTAPVVTTETTSVCTATVGDAAGNEGSATLTMTVTPPPDTTDPVVMFTPATGSVPGGQTFAATLTATDDVGVTSGPDVSCSNGGSFAGNLFTAPDVMTETTSVCTATARDAAGNEGSATLTMTVTPPDTTAPVVMFTPATGSVLSGQTFAATLTATDDVGVTSGPDVSCSNGGSFAGNLFTAPAVMTETTSVCTATAGDAAGNEGSATLTMTVTLPASVIISGRLTFDFVPHDTTTGGLDYSATRRNPMRGVVVQALNASGTVLDSDISDASGNYALDVSPVIDVRIRARAVLLRTSGATWDVRVTDNTNNNALYVLDSSLADSGTTASTRDLNAGSGWDGSAYTGERAAAPFAILDPVYETIQKFAAVDPDIVFPPVEFRWSVNNRAVQGDLEDGEITTSFYASSEGCPGNIYLLGDDNADTDEYDFGIVVHEWGHYFEDCLSRSDSIGGRHGPGDRLDPRLALGEGWGYAVAAIGTGNPVYYDSFGTGQSRGGLFNVEANTNVNAGWYNEASVWSILYDLYDSADDGADVLSLGLGPIYRTLVDPGYTGTPLFTTIFTFLDRLKAVAPGNTAAIEALAAGQGIDGTGADGAGETNDGGIASALPVYHTAVLDGAAVEVCSVDDAGFFNKLGNRAFVRVSVPVEGTYTITMIRTSGPVDIADAIFAIFRSGTVIQFVNGSFEDSETWTGVLPAGEYVIEAYNIANILVPIADFCYDITITTG